MPPAPTLIVIRGNSGSGKTTAAHGVRRRYGRGCALVEQDYLRRIVLREHDVTDMGAVAPEFITGTVRNLLDLGYHVVLEGILHRERYAGVLNRLIGGHRGPSHVYYFDVPFDETVRRNADRGFTVDETRGWWAPDDRLGVSGERVLTAPGAEDAVSTILHTSGLASAAALTPCPTRCPRCVGRLS
ncbi:AAA family ATPase [Actinoplanes sp. NPDC051343]|uniref:AAA family ATPase n=1 Tax=Actinoplanes sp. NPDC051343 TaxID=3363906 RepID=UPI0037906EB2